MDELDILKKNWNNRNTKFPEVSESQIYQMLHRKSSSIVKWILIISIVEFCFWFAISTLGKSDRYAGMPGPEWVTTFLQILDVLMYGVTFVFIFLFYRNFKNISVTSSTSELMKNIIRTRNTVQFYVRYNLVMIVLLLITFSSIALYYHPEAAAIQKAISKDYSVLLLILLIVLGATALIGLLVWLFYKLLYGLLLKRLNANYKELQKIDI